MTFAQVFKKYINILIILPVGIQSDDVFVIARGVNLDFVVYHGTGIVFFNMDLRNNFASIFLFSI